MKKKILISLLFLFIAATVGLLMRISFTTSLGFNYRYFLHTHSHIALLGWLYNLSIIFLSWKFLPGRTRQLNIIFWLSQLSFIGMLFSFPFQGYAFWSILFSTLYVFISYWLCIEIFRFGSHNNSKSISLLIKGAAVSLILSSIGPYVLGYTMANDLDNSALANLAIFWFLHFLFNGFFFLIFCALLLQQFKEHPTIFHKKEKQFAFLIVCSILPLFAQFILGHSAHTAYYLLTLSGAILQIIAFYLVRKEILQTIKNGASTISKMLLIVALSMLILRLFFQLLSAYPYLHDFIYHSKTTVIVGYVHLIMIGFYSFYYLFQIRNYKLGLDSQLCKVGILFFIAGFLTSEMLLFTQGILNYYFQSGLTNYLKWVYQLSSLMPLGIFLIVLGYLLEKRNATSQ